jgi:hypothetical protein
LMLVTQEVGGQTMSWRGQMGVRKGLLSPGPGRHGR